MNTSFTFSRLCGRRGALRLFFSIPKRQQCHSKWTRKFSLKDPRQRPQWSRSKVILAAATLTPGAFVKISEEEPEEGLTHEQEMLKISREEISKKVPDDVKGWERVWRNAVYVFDQYVFEPIATTFRFLHLMVIFVPVIVSVPIIFIGSRREEYDNERIGVVWWYGFLVNSMERAGPAFIKLGQWAASRTDIFPSQMCRIMSELHSNAKAHSLRHTKKTIEHAFGGRKFDDIFAEFDETPLGVGAIAQVYKARLKSDLAQSEDSDMDPEAEMTMRKRIRRNVDSFVKSSPQRVPSQYVAIKVLHPHVERNVRRDLKIMGVFAAMINAIPTLEWLDLPNEVENFGEMMRLQLDLRIEAANLSVFRKHFANRTTAWFPFPYAQYTTRQVLIEEFAQGIPLSVFLKNGGGVFQKDLANEGLDAFLHMLLIDNFTHSDLHPGNIMVRFYKSTKTKLHVPLITKQDPSQPTAPEDADEVEEVLARLRPHIGKQPEWDQELQKIDEEGYRPQLIFIDTGLVTELNETNRANFLDLFKSIAEFDGYKAGKLMVKRCRSPEAVIDDEVFALKMQHLVLGVKGRTFALGNIKIGDVLSQVLSMVRTHHVRMEGDFVNVVISILLLEGIGRSLDPQLDLFKAALPILRRIGSSDPTAVFQSLKSGDFSLLKIWVGLEARRFFQSSAEQTEACVKYDLLSPNL